MSSKRIREVADELWAMAKRHESHIDCGEWSAQLKRAVSDLHTAATGAKAAEDAQAERDRERSRYGRPPGAAWDD